MSAAFWSLAALLAAIVLSCFTPVHIGILSAAAAFLIGHFAAGMKPQAVAAGFPAALFLTLAGITLLFSIAQVNGTLDQLARRSVRLARGNRGLDPAGLLRPGGRAGRKSDPVVSRPPHCSPRWPCRSPSNAGSVRY